MPINLQQQSDKIEQLFGEAFNGIQRNFEEIIQPMSLLQFNLDYNNQQQHFLLHIQEQVPHFQMPEFPQQMSTHTFKRITMNSIDINKIKPQQIQRAKSATKSFKSSQILDQNQKKILQVKENMLKNQLESEQVKYQQQLQQIKLDTDYQINLLKQQLEEKKQQQFDVIQLKEMQIENEKKWVEEERIRLQQIDQVIRQRQEQNQRLEQELQQKAVQLKQEIYKFTNSNVKLKLQADIEHLLQQRTEMEQQMSMEQARRKQELMDLDRALEVRRRDQVDQRMQNDVTFNTERCMKFFQVQEPQPARNTNQFAKPVQNDGYQNESISQNQRVKVELNQRQSSQRQSSQQISAPQMQNVQNVQNVQNAQRVDTPVLYVSPQHQQMQLQLDQVSNQIEPLQQAQVAQVVDQQKVEEYNQNQVQQQGEQEQQYNLVEEQVETNVKQVSRQTSNRQSGSRDSGNSQKSRHSNVEVDMQLSHVEQKPNQNEQITFEMQYPPLSQQALYKIPTDFRAGIERDKVPVAEWAVGENLQKCIIQTARIRPEQYYNQQVKPSVQELFGVNNHPFDNKARCTQVWNKDKVTQKDFEEYNKYMKWK